jgi:hypothetical protein
MSQVTKNQPDPNAKSDGRKRQEMEAKLKKQAEEKAAAEAETQKQAERAGGTGMVSQAAPAEDRKVDALDPLRFHGAEFKRNQYIATAGEGVKPVDISDPGYWAHLGAKLRPWDEIMVRANDGLWYARLIVLEAGRNWAKVHVESVTYLTTAEVAITQADAMSPYEVTYRGPHSKWSVIRKQDRAVVHEGSETMDAAMTWLKERLKAEK